MIAFLGLGLGFRVTVEVRVSHMLSTLQKLFAEIFDLFPVHGAVVHHEPITKGSRDGSSRLALN